jgi:copper transport protein
MLGLVGVLLGLGLMAYQLPGLAERRHMTAGALLTSDAQSAMQLGFLLVAALGFGLASGRANAGWVLAAIGVVVGALRAALVGKWASLVNPIHVLAASLWIGTLFVLVVAGLSALLKHEPTRARRGAIAADMVNGFSPLALTMGGVVVLFGLITAWRHLHRVSALWTTPYGFTLIAKLCVVACVFALGGWNWRRQRPTLGTESAASSIHRSASLELAVATIVLVITSVLVSLPSPKA